jgi:hypothetical protein
MFRKTVVYTGGLKKTTHFPWFSLFPRMEGQTHNGTENGSCPCSIVTIVSYSLLRCFWNMQSLKFIYASAPPQHHMYVCYTHYLPIILNSYNYSQLPTRLPMLYTKPTYQLNSFPCYLSKSARST